MSSASCIQDGDQPPKAPPKYSVKGQKNFGLSPAEFERLVQALKNGNRSLYEQVFLAHFEDCLKYLQRKYKANYNDAYDISMETMLRFMQRLKKGKVVYGNLRFLFTQMASQLYLKFLRKGKLFEDLPLPDLTEESLENEEALFRTLEEAWRELSEQQQQLLKAYYYDGIPLKELAKQQGLTAIALRKRKQRGMDVLKRQFMRRWER